MSTWINDLKNNLVFANDANSLAAASRTATASGGAVDLVDAEGNCFAILNVGTVTGTSPTLDVKIQDRLMESARMARRVNRSSYFPKVDLNGFIGRSGAAFTQGTCPGGPFTGTSRLKPAGVWVRDKILNR